MPDPLSIAAVGLQGVSLISSIFGGSSAEKAAKRQAAEEARIEREVTAERIQQLEIEERVLRGETIANTGASGVKTTGATPLAVLAEQEYQFARERMITNRVGASRAAAALGRGEATAAQYRTQTYSNIGAAAGNIFSILSENKRSTGKYFGI